MTPLSYIAPPRSRCTPYCGLPPSRSNRATADAPERQLRPGLAVPDLRIWPQSFTLADAKTEAGVREVEIALSLRDELLDYMIGLPEITPDSLRRSWPTR